MDSESTPDEIGPLLPRKSPDAGATAVLVLSTFVAVSGSYVFGCAVGYSSPAQSGILNDLDLTLPEYSLFGSISTIGAMFGAIVSGKIADLFGRKGAMGFAELFNVIGWLAIGFSKLLKSSIISSCLFSTEHTDWNWEYSRRLEG